MWSPRTAPGSLRTRTASAQTHREEHSFGFSEEFPTNWFHESELDQVFSGVRSADEECSYVVCEFRVGKFIVLIIECRRNASISLEAGLCVQMRYKCYQ